MNFCESTTSLAPAAGQWAVVSASGGLDSTSLWLHLLARGLNVALLSFRYGQKHELELEYLSRNVAYLREQGHPVLWKIVDLSTLGPLLHSALINPEWDVPEGHYEQDNMKATVVPNRNAIFASIAYAWALSLAEQHPKPVWFGLGVHSGDHAIYPDCRPEFYDALLAAFARGNWGSEQVQAYLPYLNYTKSQILRDAAESIANLQLDFDRIFAQTLTSYAPDSQGRSRVLSGSDVERILAFAELGRPDPLPYIQPWAEVVAQARRWEEVQQRQNSP